MISLKYFQVALMNHEWDVSKAAGEINSETSPECQYNW